MFCALCFNSLTGECVVLIEMPWSWRVEAKCFTSKIFKVAPPILVFPDVSHTWQCPTMYLQKHNITKCAKTKQQDNKPEGNTTHKRQNKQTTMQNNMHITKGKKNKSTKNDSGCSLSLKCLALVCLACPCWSDVFLLSFYASLGLPCTFCGLCD